MREARACRHPKAARRSHAEVAVVDSSSGELLERTARYRQVARRAMVLVRGGVVEAAV